MTDPSAETESQYPLQESKLQSLWHMPGQTILNLHLTLTNACTCLLATLEKMRVEYAGELTHFTSFTQQSPQYSALFRHMKNTRERLKS
mmetsp:Transcript_11808/g.23691  ORF Transcript_11808/g.23691 Transcript_11808/m.23691 type:complete len:89 (+) Transcript_11808:611-877(+)